MLNWYQLVNSPCWIILIGDITLLLGYIPSLLLVRSFTPLGSKPLAVIQFSPFSWFQSIGNLLVPTIVIQVVSPLSESQVGAFFGGLGISISWTGQGLFFSLVVPTACGDAALGGPLLKQFIRSRVTTVVKTAMLSFKYWEKVHHPFSPGMPSKQPA